MTHVKSTLVQNETALQRRVERILREHIRVDSSGLAPAVVSAFLFGFEEAARAVVEAINDER